MKWFKILQEQPVYWKLVLISFWQKSGQNWQNGGHFKKIQFLNLNLKFKTQKPLEIERNGLNLGITGVFNDHSKTFFKISKISKKIQKFKNKFKSSKIFNSRRVTACKIIKFWNFWFAAFWLAYKHLPLFHL